jgi:hypothetical protein
MSIATVTFQPAEAAAYDSYMYAGADTTNYGTASVMKVGTVTPIGDTYYYKPILKFDMSATIPTTASVLAASLFVYISADNAANARTVKVVRCLRNWVESEVTHLIYSTGNSWTGAGGAGAGDRDGSYCGQVDFTATQVNGDEKEFPITTLSVVQGWIETPATNYGLIMDQLTSTADNWDLHSSSSATAGYRPKLTVTYTTGGGGNWW